MPDTPTLADSIEFAENPDPRCPCVLLLDTSGSMGGAPIAALNDGVRAFQEEVTRPTGETQVISLEAHRSFGTRIVLDVTYELSNLALWGARE